MQSKENKDRWDNAGKAKNNIDKPEQQRKVKNNNKRQQRKKTHKLKYSLKQNKSMTRWGNAGTISINKVNKNKCKWDNTGESKSNVSKPKHKEKTITKNQAAKENQGKNKTAKAKW